MTQLSQRHPAEHPEHLAKEEMKSPPPLLLRKAEKLSHSLLSFGERSKLSSWLTKNLWKGWESPRKPTPLALRAQKDSMYPSSQTKSRQAARSQRSRSRNSYGTQALWNSTIAASIASFNRATPQSLIFRILEWNLTFISSSMEMATTWKSFTLT